MTASSTSIPPSSEAPAWRGRPWLEFFRRHATRLFRLSLYCGLMYVALIVDIAPCTGQGCSYWVYHGACSGPPGCNSIHYSCYDDNPSCTNCSWTDYMNFCFSNSCGAGGSLACGCGGFTHTLTVSGSVSCVTPGNGVWCRGGSALDLSANDSDGGHAVTIFSSVGNCGGSTSNPSCSIPLGDAAGATISYYAQCPSGPTGTSTATYSQDSVAPVVTTALSGGVLGAGGWYLSGPVALSCGVADSGSGPINPATYGTQTSGAGDGSYPLSCTGYDVAGNSTSAGATVNIDGTPPVITPTISGGTLGGGGYYTSGPVSLTCAAIDSGSGSPLVTYGTMTATAPGTTVLDCTATDLAGNSSYYSVPIMLDGEAPLASFSYLGSRCATDWFNSPVLASVVLTDAISGPGGAQWWVDGEAWDSTKPIEDGVHALTGIGGDLAGNLVEFSDTLRVDRYPPLSSFITESNSWFAGIFTLKGQSVDWTSGISLVEISLDNGKTWIAIGGKSDWSYEWDTLDPATPVPDGAYTVLARAKDNACNQEHTAVITVNVDNTPPDLSLKDTINLMGRTTTVIATDLGSGVDHGTVTITGNGIEPVEIQFASSTEVTWDGKGGDGRDAPFGLYDVLVEVWDRVGNSNTATGTWLRPAPVEPTAVPPPVVNIVIPPAPKPDVELSQTVVVRETFWRIAVWPAVALSFLFIGLGAGKIFDRRPDELRKLGDALARRSAQGRR